MRKKIVAANWKMNMLQAEAAEFVKDLLLEIGDMSAVEVVIVPPFTALAKVVDIGLVHLAAPDRLDVEHR